MKDIVFLSVLEQDSKRHSLNSVSRDRRLKLFQQRPASSDDLYSERSTGSKLQQQQQTDMRMVKKVSISCILCMQKMDSRADLQLHLLQVCSKYFKCLICYGEHTEGSVNHSQELINNNNNNNVHLYLASAIFQSIIRKLNSLSIEALTAKPS